MLPAVRALRSRADRAKEPGQSREASREHRHEPIKRPSRTRRTGESAGKTHRKPELSPRTSLLLISVLTLTAMLLPGLVAGKWQDHPAPKAAVPYLQAGAMAPGGGSQGSGSSGGGSGGPSGSPPGSGLPGAAHGAEGTAPGEAGQDAGRAPGDGGSRPPAASGDTGKAEADPAARAGTAAAAASPGAGGREAASSAGSPGNPYPASGLPDPVSQSPDSAAAPKGGASELDRTEVRVYLAKEKRVETVPLELYVRGVIAGEMPVDFELEALKAQAIAARTYIVRRLAMGSGGDMPVGNADVTDTTDHQVYVPLAALVKRWPEETRRENLTKLNEAVRQTRGQIVTYGGEPIEALFFSTSNGYTENSEDYWNRKVPYLRSVASPWDENLSPSYKETVTLSLAEFYRKLGASGSPRPAIRVLETTEGRRIKEIAVGSTRLSGREIREKLGLASSQFSWKIDGSSIHITTYGSGHGVGMSQWGADGMAREGASALRILAHYYSGTRVEKALKMPAVKS